MLAESNYDFERFCLLIDAAAYGNQLELVQKLLGKSHKILQNTTYDAAIQSGKADVFFHLQKIRKFFTNDMVYIAVVHGNLSVLEWLFDRFAPTPMAGYAIKGGHLQVLKFLYTQGIRPTVNDLSQAILYGHVAIVQWIHDTFGYPLIFPQTEGMVGYDLDMLQYSESKQVKWYCPQILCIINSPQKCQEFNTFQGAQWLVKYLNTADQIEYFGYFMRLHSRELDRLAQDACSWTPIPTTTRYSCIIDWLENNII